MDVADDGMESDERENLSEAQEQAGSPEAHEAKIKPSPEKPTQDEVARHDATHCPYRSWCEVCVAASAREDPHPRKDKRNTENGLPVIQADLTCLRSISRC